MKNIFIRAESEIGEEALKRHWAESNTRKNRLALKMAGYSQELVSESPYTICLKVKTKRAEHPAFMQLIIEEINKGLKGNGAEDVRDYTIKIEEAS